MARPFNVTRRQFLWKSSVIAACTTFIPVSGFSKSRGRLSSKEARYYTKLPDKKVQCKLCPHRCIVRPGKRGNCETRENRDGIYYSLVYGRIATHHKDPIEKKPFYHFSRFYPKYKLKNLPPTPVATLEKLRNVALDGGLHYVYLGNVPGHSGENTSCPHCRNLIIGRSGYEIFENQIVNGKCHFCGQEISGVWEV